MNQQETIVFGGGCFWCTEAIFNMIKGVSSVTSGYAGGSMEAPTYEQVSSGKTGHAEAVKITYDPSVVRFDDLLTVFFATHDPTTRNQQGNDVGEQYRSIVLWTTQAQRDATAGFIKKLNLELGNTPVVTETKKLEKFYDAEEYHRKYYVRNQSNPYCQIVINPKLEKLKKQFKALLKQA